MTKPLFDEKEDWTFEKLDAAYDEIEKIALNELKLDVYPNQIEMINAEQMLDAYASNGLPIHYRHWSLGKSFVSNERSYSAGQSNLAYEIVINSLPCISFLQDSNDMTMQSLVIAHACFGHNAFFKGNDEFKRWTRAETVLDELEGAKKFIARCEERYGESEVEEILDACHALMNHGVDTAPRPSVSARTIEKRQETPAPSRDPAVEYDLLWSKTVDQTDSAKRKREEEFAIQSSWKLESPEENILYFIEKNASWLPSWKREIIRIVRKQAQYFHPQMLTKTANEGLASFTHYFCMNRLHQKGLITDGAWFNFIRSHTNVVLQPDFDDPRYYGLNPYALGFAIFKDLQRVCNNPLPEDREHLPGVVGRDFIDVLHDAFEHHNDSTFIGQFMSPTVARDFKFFILDDVPSSTEYSVSSVCDNNGFPFIRSALAEKHTRSAKIPQIEVIGADILGDRKMTLRYVPYKGRELDANSTEKTIAMVKTLWGYPVAIEK